MACQALKKLTLFSSTEITGESIRFFAGELPSSLEKVTLVGVDFKDGAVKSLLEKKSHIKSLCLRLTPRITKEAFCNLGNNSTQLERLRLVRMRFNFDTLDEIAKSNPQLNTIVLKSMPLLTGSAIGAFQEKNPMIKIIKKL